MKTSFTKKQLSLAVTCALVLGFASSAVCAQSLPKEERELWTETRTQVWRNGYGECWHSMYGPPPGYGECNPAPVAQYVAPAPAPAPYVAPPPAPVVVAPPPPAPTGAVAAPVVRPIKRDRN